MAVVKISFTLVHKIVAPATAAVAAIENVFDIYSQSARNGHVAYEMPKNVGLFLISFPYNFLRQCASESMRTDRQTDRQRVRGFWSKRSWSVLTLHSTLPSCSSVRSSCVKCTNIDVQSQAKPESTWPHLHAAASNFAAS